MPDKGFAQFIKNLPEADIPFPGVRGWLSQGKDNQVVFFEIEPIGEVPVHTHGEQWGVVIDGEMELTIGGETRLMRSGDTFHVPAGVEHGAKFLTHFRSIDVFADRERYKTK